MGYKDKARQQEACHTHYLAHKARYIARAKTWNTENRKKLRKYIAGYLQSHYCVDCGEKDPIVLTFDHVRGIKKGAIATGVSRGWSLKTLIKEIAKCEVRCFNCHMRRTYRDRSYVC